MKSERFQFKNNEGETLSGRLELPTGTSHPVAFAIFAHCFTCSKNVNAASQISRALAELGIAVLRFDFTGLGNSEGDFSNTNFSSNVEDLVSAAAALKAQHQSPQLLIGHSLGGTAAYIAAHKIAGIRAVASIGSPADPQHVTKLFGDNISEIETRGAYQVKLAGREFKIRKQFLDDVSSFNYRQSLGKLACASMVFHSPVDELVGIDQARLIYEALPHPKNFVSVDGADHLLSRKTDAKFIALMLANWAGRYLQENAVATGTETDASPSVGKGEVVVREVSGFTQHVSTSDHSFYADEPLSVGGQNKGMTPYDLLLASLGACTSMTLRMYANHKKISLRSISVRLNHQKVHADDCADCDNQSRDIFVVNKTITVEGDLTPEQVVRLKEIADRCPVHRTMMREKKIETTIQLIGN